MLLVGINKYSVLFLCTSGQALAGRKPLCKRNIIKNHASLEELIVKTDRRKKEHLEMMCKTKEKEKKTKIKLLIPGLEP